MAGWRVSALHEVAGEKLSWICPRPIFWRCQIDQNINRFWQLMSKATGVDLVRLDSPSRLDALLEQRVGLWDVVAEAPVLGQHAARYRIVELPSSSPAYYTLSYAEKSRIWQVLRGATSAPD